VGDPPSRVGLDVARRVCESLICVSGDAGAACEAVRRGWRARGGDLPRGSRVCTTACGVEVVDSSTSRVLFAVPEAAQWDGAATGSGVCLRLEDEAVVRMFGESVGSLLCEMRSGPSAERKRSS
jgi:hypothetical protein